MYCRLLDSRIEARRKTTIGMRVSIVQPAYSLDMKTGGCWIHCWRCRDRCGRVANLVDDQTYHCRLRLNIGR